MRKGGSPGRGPGRPVSWCIGASSGLPLALHDPRDGQDSRSEVPGRALARSTSYQALHSALARLYRIDDFHMERIGAGFFSEVFKVSVLYHIVHTAVKCRYEDDFAHISTLYRINS